MAQTLRLTRKQRQALFDGECPRIAGTGTCPVEKGFELTLSSLLTLTVLEVRFTKGGGWSLHYQLTDRRDPARLLRRTPTIRPGEFAAVRRSYDEYGAPKPPTEEAIAEAAEDSSYTGSYSSLAEAGEAVDDMTLKRFAKQALGNDADRARRRRERHELQALSDRLATLEGETGVDLSRQMAAVAKTINAMEEKTRRRKAA